MDKEDYFRQLSALNENSDSSEEDSNDAREVLLKSTHYPNSPSSSFSSSFSHSSRSGSQRRNQPPKAAPKKIPGIHRTASAPVPSPREVKETPPLPRKCSLLHYDTSSSGISGALIQETPSSSAVARPAIENSASTPNIGSVVMRNSTGIASMLRRSMEKKRKRKEVSIKLVPEEQRIFSDKTFFFIPPDDIPLARRTRINRARSFGATWTKEWIPSITHVVVDKSINFQEVMKFFKNTLKLESIPLTIILVNEDYPFDCTNFGSILDPNQLLYAIQGQEPSRTEVVQTPSQKSDTSLQVKPSRNDGPAKQTPPGSQHSTQNEPVSAAAISGSSPRAWLPDIPQEAEIVKSPRKISEPQPEKHITRRVKKGDDLDEMIEAAFKLADIPLSDSEDDSRPSSRDEAEDASSSDEEARVRAPKKKRKSGDKGSFNQENFICMKAGAQTGIALEENPNLYTINLLEELGKYYERIGDQWRTRAYRIAIGVLKKQSNKISTYDDALELNGIGQRIATKIEEIVVTKRLRRLEYAQLEPDDEPLQLFLGIYGVGISQARKWIQQGYKTFDDLKTNVRLSKNQLLGIEHYSDFNTRIPREEVTALGEIVKKAAAEIDPEVQAIIGGSYRRGAPTSGDIDFLLTKPGTISGNDLMPFLNELVSRLTSTNFLVAALATPHSSTEGSKWHGACVLPNSEKKVWRRIDLLLVPETEFGAALIYFTGDDIFNRSIRLLSSKKGMRLNQRGLYRDVLRGSGRVKINEGTLVEGKDERAIFERLGVPWRLPEERVCH